MEVQGSADEIVPNMLTFLKEQTVATGDTPGGGADAAPQEPTTAEVTDEDRDL